jgi:hypothetical protein
MNGKFDTFTSLLQKLPILIDFSDGPPVIRRRYPNEARFFSVDLTRGAGECRKLDSTSFPAGA